MISSRNAKEEGPELACDGPARYRGSGPILGSTRLWSPLLAANLPLLLLALLGEKPLAKDTHDGKQQNEHHSTHQEDAEDLRLTRAHPIQKI